MKHAVITGSSSGIGFGLATEFLKNGFSVTISGKNGEKLNSAGEKLIKSFSKNSVHIQTCDVRLCSDIKNLWNSAKNRFEHVDIWINNAGTGQDFIFIKDFEEEAINLIIDTNIKGVIHASRIIYNKMAEQGFGAVYNMEGFGSDGRKMQKMSIYGTSKSALSYFTKSFIKETIHSPVIIGTISPGMVLTDLFLRPADRDEKEEKRFLKITNILADNVETVTPWLVNKMINNTKHDKSFNWLNSTKVTARFISSLFRKRKLLSPADLNIKTN